LLYCYVILKYPSLG